MERIFPHFDFSLLDDPDFREDSVREELIVPLLRSLGYSASGPDRILRSRKLEHPYVYFGTVKKDISIIPDYLLEKEGALAWILDAKAPNERIDSGKNVEQAYSYAMHRDVRVPIYALCNGRRLTVFHVLESEPLLDIALENIQDEWLRILTLLGSKAAWPDGNRPDFLPDLGLALSKSGLAFDKDGKEIFQMFLSLPVMMISKVEDNLITMSAPIGSALFENERQACMGSFDFSSEVYEDLLQKLDEDISIKVRSALSRQPYQIAFLQEEAPHVTFAAQVGGKTYRNSNESYRPFVVKQFI